MRATRVGLRLVLAATVLAAVVAVVGPDRLVTTLQDADPVMLGAAVGAQILALSMWGISLAVVLGPVDRTPTGTALLGAYCAGLLLRSLVPWGRSGGAVFTAVALTRVSGAGFERLLAASLAADLLRFLVSIAVAATGVGLLASTGSTTAGAPTAAVVATIGVLLVLTGIVVVAPQVATRVVVRAAQTVAGTVGRVSTTVAKAFDPTTVADRTTRFFQTVHGLTHDRRTLAWATGLAAVGWALALLPLYFTLAATGITVATPVLMIVVPAAGLAGITPLPGGTGGVEVALLGLLVGIAGVDITIAGTVTILYRAATFWVTLLLATVGTAVFTELSTPPAVTVR